MAKILKKGDSALNKHIFKERVGHASYDIKQTVGVVLMCAVVAAEALGLSHHYFACLSRKVSIEKDMVQIETNIKDGVGFEIFTGNAISATEIDGKYYVEIFGVGSKEDGGAPEFCSLKYEIGKDLYDDICEYYDIEFKFNIDGQVTKAENKLISNKEFFGHGKSLRADSKVKEKLADEVTKKAPVSITWHNANDIEVDGPEM